MPRAPAIAAAAVFAAALVLYACTLTPTVALVDSGELVIAAQSLGVAHPPGFPAYVLVAHLATRIPFGSIAQRANFASAVFAALAAAMLMVALAQALRTPRGRRGRPNSKRAPESAAENAGSIVIPILVAGTLLAGSRTLWGYATLAEVYTLNTLVNAAVLALVLFWRRRRLEAGAGHRDDRPLLAAAWLFGFGLGVHIVTVGLLLPGFAVLVLATDRGFLQPRRLLPAALLAFAGLSVYAYLPFAAAHDPAMNWGDPDTWEKFVRHITGRQYWVSFSLTAEQARYEIGAFARYLARELGPPWLPAALVLAVVGWIDALRRDRALAVGLSLITLADVAYGICYQIAEDKDAYYLPAFMAIAFAAGLGAAALLRARSAGLARVPRPALAAGLLLLPAVAVASNLPFNDRHRDMIARDYVNDALSTMEPGALFLTGDWQLYAPLLYFREAEALRTDVIAIDVRLLRRSWYFDYLRSRWPRFMARHAGVVDPFVDDLRAWESDSKGFEQDRTRLVRIDQRFFGMILSMIRDHLESASVYATQDVPFVQRGEDQPLAQAILSTWSLVPRGLVFELRRDSTFVDPPPPPPAARSPLRARARFENDDVVMIKVVPVYAGMHALRGRYLAGHGRHDRAIEAYREALAISPALPGIVAAMEESRQALARTSGR